jgi:hypothetical protein
MPVQRLYIYRCGATNACALTGEKGESRLPTPLTPKRWQFWMQTTRDQTDDALYGFSLDTAMTQIAARGYYLFTGSTGLLDARVGVKASSPDGVRQHRRSTTSTGTTAAYRLIRSAPHGPETINMLVEVHNEVWASISSGLDTGFHESEFARIQLAAIVLDLARDGQLGELQIARTAARLMRENNLSIKQPS